MRVEASARLHGLLAEFPCELIPFRQDQPSPRGECDIEIMELAFALRMPPEEPAAEWLRVDGFGLPKGTVGLCLNAGDWDADRRIAPEWFTATPLQRHCIALDLGRSALAVMNPGGCPADLPATAALVAGWTERVLFERQPQQAQHDAQPEIPQGAGDCPRTGKRQRDCGRKL